MRRDSKFEKAVLEYFGRFPKGQLQRIDGVRCFSRLDRFLFLQWRLDSMARRGLIRRAVLPAFWRSTQGMPWYGPVDKEKVD